MKAEIRDHIERDKFIYQRKWKAVLTKMSTKCGFEFPGSRKEKRQNRLFTEFSQIERNIKIQVKRPKFFLNYLLWRICHIEQKSGNYSMINFSPLPFLIKFYCNMVTPISLPIVYGLFLATMAELSSRYIPPLAHKA